MKKKQYTFKGGYRFRRIEGCPRDMLTTQDIPNEVLIPLKQGFGMGVVSLVKEGDIVVAGQIIGRDDSNVSSPVHASVSGVVKEIKLSNYLGHETQIVRISTRKDKADDCKKVKGFTSDWAKLKNEEIESILYLAGVTSLDKSGIPTKFKSSIITPKDVRSIIVPAIGFDVYNLSQELLLGEKRVLDYIEGLRILHAFMPQANIYLALSKTDMQINEKLSEAVSQYGFINIISLEPKYPQGYDEMLVATVLGEKFPFGYYAANLGVIVLNAQTILSVYEAVVKGKPLIERTIAICGPGFNDTPHLKVRIGTPIADILKSYLRTDVSSRIVLENTLVGDKLTDLSLPVTKATSKIIALPENNKREFFSFLRLGVKRDAYSNTFASSVFPFFGKTLDTNIHGELRPCISCNYCEEVCPVQIIPHLLGKYVKNNIIDDSLVRFKIFNCIGCGLCSYVCPSKIPLLELIREGEKKLAMEGIERSSSILPHFKLKGLKEYKGITTKL